MAKKKKNFLSEFVIGFRNVHNFFTILL